jgi:Dolichyl-phosphate-mannose-protein mannosyltransferase
VPDDPATVPTRGHVPHRFRLAAAPWWLPAALAYTVLRLPSLLQPHWYTDEAGYAAVGREMLSGRIPYSQIWNNKPPLHLATVGAVVRLFGSSETALHLLTFVFGAVALAGALYMAAHLFSPRVAATVGAMVAVMLGLPLFDADLAIPESLLIAPATWAAAIVVVRLHQGRTVGTGWAVAAGLLAAATVCYQQTAVADAGALGLILLLHPNARPRHFVAFAAAAIAATLAWVIPVAILAGAHTLGFAMVGFYAGDYNLSALPDAHTPLHFTLLAAAVLLAVAGAVLARIRRAGTEWMLAVWAVATLMVPAAAQQPFAHFAGPAVVPVLLTGAALLGRREGLATRLATGAPLLAAVVLAGLMARSAGVDWIPNAASAGMNGYRTLSTYYVGAMEAMTGRLDWSDWEKQWDDRAPADTAVSTWLREHGLAGQSAVVWSSDAWPYLLADLPVLLPTPPIYNDRVLLGSNGEVTDRVRALAPEIILTSDDAVATFPEISKLVQAQYHQVFSSLPDRVYLRNGTALPGSQP